MKFAAKFTLLLAGLFFVHTSFAQLNLPQKSPKASVSYVVGLTEITINYSRPNVNDRVIWGDLVPHGEVWRAGANECTTIEFSTDITVEGQDVKAGKYSFFLIPTEGEEWTGILNNNTELWGQYGYKQEEDAARFVIKPKTSRVNQKRLEYSITDQSLEKGYIGLAWEKQRIYLRFKIKTMDIAMANIESALSESEEGKKGQVYANSAEFLSEHEDHITKALEFAGKSTEIASNSRNWWVKAQVESKAGKTSDAIASAKKSLEVGEATEGDRFYENMKENIEKTIAEWGS